MEAPLGEFLIKAAYMRIYWNGKWEVYPLFFLGVGPRQDEDLDIVMSKVLGFLRQTTLFSLITLSFMVVRMSLF